MTRGWCNYFKHGVSKATFSYLGYFTWHRVARWVFRRHNRLAWKHIKRRFMIGWTFAADGIAMLNPASIAVTRYRYRREILNPWSPARIA